VLRDFFALYILNPDSDAIAVLPGWESSVGALGEVALARWLGLRILDATTGEALVTADWYTLGRALQQTLNDQRPWGLGWLTAGPG